MIMVWTYTIYLLLSLALTVFVARTLHKNGRVFLVDSFGGNALDLTTGGTSDDADAPNSCWARGDGFYRTSHSLFHLCD